nr:sulfur transferase domain-containing protein [Pseudoalteromonas luteoviolacea]
MTLHNLKESGLSICFFQVISEKLIVGGQPTEQDLIALKSHGIKRVVNCIPDYEQKWNEQAVVSQLGMEYLGVGFDRTSGITIANAQTLFATLKTCSDQPTFLHCLTGNRIGILIAVYHYFLLGKPEKEAISEGLFWGMRDKTAFMNIVEESIQ